MLYTELTSAMFYTPFHIRTLVWERFTVEYFHVKILHGEIFLFLGHPTKIFNNELCSLIVHIILHSHNMHYTNTDYGVLTLIGSLPTKIHTSNSSVDLQRPGCFILRHQFAQGFQFPRIDRCIHQINCNQDIPNGLLNQK